MVSHVEDCRVEGVRLAIWPETNSLRRVPHEKLGALHR